MSVTEIENAVARLPEAEFSQFAKWFEEYMADKWDRQIEQDAGAGRLDHLAREADEAFEKGECTSL